MAPYLPTAGPAARVVDLIDALSLNMARRYQYDRPPLRWLAWLEAARLLRYERRLCESVDRAVVCASPDREAIGPFARLAIVGNGVDPTEHVFERDGRDPHAIVLSGNMGYFPNVHAARWFAGQVLPRVRRAVPEVTLRIVGARPHRTVRHLAVVDPAVIVVSGFVDRMHSHLRRAGIAVAPLHAGSGQALKVLEAMASGTPVVATPVAAAGVGARHDEHLLVAEGPQAFADQTVRLLRDAALADRLAASARRLVETRHTWEHSIDALEAVYRSAMEERRSRDGGPAFP
jgi:glycosyltransferase involved in cell wall biosynthesis